MSAPKPYTGPSHKVSNYRTVRAPAYKPGAKPGDDNFLPVAHANTPSVPDTAAVAAAITAGLAKLGPGGAHESIAVSAPPAPFNWKPFLYLAALVVGWMLYKRK